MINITFPDGSVRGYESGVTPFQVAESISPVFAADVLVAKVNGQDWDISRPIAEDASIELFQVGFRKRVSMRFGIRLPIFLQRHCRSFIPV